MSKPDFEKMAFDAVDMTVGRIEYVKRKDCARIAELAYAAGLERAAEICQARYMGDNTRVDMEARRCAEAIRAEREKTDG